MNTKTNLWSVKISSPERSEVVQRLAFTFGYCWPVGEKTVQYTDKNFLVFYPNEKVMRHSNGIVIDHHNEVSHVVSTFDDVLKFLINPPDVPKTKRIDNGGINFDLEINTEGDVFCGYHRIPTKLFDTVVEERNKLIGIENPKQKLHQVKFEYDSMSSRRKVRNILKR